MRGIFCSVLLTCLAVAAPLSADPAMIHARLVEAPGPYFSVVHPVAPWPDAGFYKKCALRVGDEICLDLFTTQEDRPHIGVMVRDEGKDSFDMFVDDCEIHSGDQTFVLDAANPMGADFGGGLEPDDWQSYVLAAPDAPKDPVLAARTYPAGQLALSPDASLTCKTADFGISHFRERLYPLSSRLVHTGWFMEGPSRIGETDPDYGGYLAQNVLTPGDGVYVDLWASGKKAVQQGLQVRNENDAPVQVTLSDCRFYHGEKGKGLVAFVLVDAPGSATLQFTLPPRNEVTLSLSDPAGKWPGGDDRIPKLNPKNKFMLPQCRSIAVSHPPP